jgi:single-strand DNA-binding protein
MSTFNFSGVGRLVQDPVTKTVGSGVVLEFTLAEDYYISKADGSKEKKTNFIDFQAWGKQAEIIAQYSSKGDWLYVSGGFRKDIWEKEGEKRSKVYFRLDNFQFVSTKKKEETTQEPVNAPNEAVPY